MSNIYAFDIETFPNLFTMAVSNVEDDFDEYFFVIGLGRDDREQIKEFVKGKTLVGYNNIHFDNVVLNAALSGKQPKELYEIAVKIVFESEDSGPEIYRFKSMPANYKSIDLMKMYAFDKEGIGLKLVSILIKWHRVQELDLPFDQVVEEKDLKRVLEYNSNDVQITKAFYKKSLKMIETRRSIGKLYGADLVSASDSKIGNILVEKMYSEHTGLLPERFKLLRTERECIELRNCISKDISFETPVFQSLLKELTSLTLKKEEKKGSYGITKEKFDFKKSVNFSNKEYTFGLGGLHSQDESGIFESNSEYFILDADVGSFYPNIMLRNKIRPQHLGEEVTSILSTLTRDRMAAKKAKDSVKAEAMKIAINAFFGKLGHDKYWLYDPEALYNVTISGQLYLFMLIESLTLKGIEVISANTDGVTCKVYKEKLKEYRQVCLDWEKLTNFELEIVLYMKYVRKDVSNYVALQGGKFSTSNLLDLKLEYKEFTEKDLKKKGLFEEEKIKEEKVRSKSYSSPIIPKALNNYFLRGIPIDQTINSSEDIYDFFMFQKCAKNFELYYQNGKGPEKVQRISRFYATLEGGELYKLDQERGSKISLKAGVLVKVLNDVPVNKDFKDLKVDKNYYIQETLKVSSLIENSKFEQISLW